MTRAFHDPSEPVGICGCGAIIPPSDDQCASCQAESADPLDLDHDPNHDPDRSYPIRRIEAFTSGSWGQH